MNICAYIARLIAVMALLSAVPAQAFFTTEFDETLEQCKENPSVISKLESQRVAMLESLLPLRQKQDATMRLSPTEAELLFQAEMVLNSIDGQLIKLRYGQYLCEELERLKNIIDSKTIVDRSALIRALLFYI